MEFNLFSKAQKPFGTEAARPSVWRAPPSRYEMALFGLLILGLVWITLGHRTATTVIMVPDRTSSTSRIG